MSSHSDRLIKLIFLKVIKRLNSFHRTVIERLNSFYRTVIERFNSFFAESARFGAVAVHVQDVEIALGGAARRIRQPMAV